MRVCVAGNHLTLTYGKSRREQVAQAPAEPTWPWQGANRAIVVTRLEEDVSWLLQYFSEIPIAVYQSRDPGDPRYFDGKARSFCRRLVHPVHFLRPAVFKVLLLQKGREVFGWLNFIIDNYHQVPESTLFIHAHRSAASSCLKPVTQTNPTEQDVKYLPCKVQVQLAPWGLCPSDQAPPLWPLGLCATGHSAAARPARREKPAATSGWGAREDRFQCHSWQDSGTAPARCRGH